VQAAAATSATATATSTVHTAAVACGSSDENETVLLMKLPPSKRNAYTMFRSGAAATAIAAVTGLQPSTVSLSLVYTLQQNFTTKLTDSAAVLLVLVCSFADAHIQVNTYYDTGTSCKCVTQVYKLLFVMMWFQMR
jgi:hypothetical protein